MSQSGLHSANGLDNSSFDVILDLGDICPDLLQVAPHERQTSLVTLVVLLATFVLNVVFVKLIDGIVSQVHIQVAKVLAVWRLIVHGGQAG